MARLSDAWTVIGTATTRKVHMAWGHNGNALCGGGIVVTDSLGDLADGQETTIAALLAAKVAPTRLCGKCFYPRLRAIYRATYNR
ncbi:hypothetical protein [Amycolatopsis sp. DSM 110486]|uniref:hypothetical protein n=1 Tax=Amycolatopsis sp. DSM 110486 TaxID=2865832 RepID=UPI001C69B608|nr:hypothetical protein [Amycolatopsis sp. DSM 110486]QYN17506.1 hypothetical protein K1T34_32490 [Amycolatopsis sp. DSM 110486]